MAGEEKSGGIFKALLADHVNTYAACIEDDFLNACDSAGSEIEKMMLAQLMFCTFDFLHAPASVLNQKEAANPHRLRGVMDSWRAAIIPQFQIGRHRVDFLVVLPGANGETMSFIVECDGHDFHDKTKEQAARDKKRDRELQAKGYHVFRFTGSEIWRDIGKCVDELSEYGAHWVFGQIRNGDK